MKLLWSKEENIQIIQENVQYKGRLTSEGFSASQPLNSRDK